MSEGYSGFSAEERAAMKEYAAELKNAVARKGTGAKKAEADLQDALAVIEGLSGTDREIGDTLHAVVTTHAPHLAARTWYGMPAYAKDGKVIVFFKPASKFKVRYAEVGFNEFAQLDDGDIWPTVFAVAAMNDTVKNKIVALVKKASA